MRSGGMKDYWIGVRKMNNRKLKFCPDLTQVVWAKAMMVGNGDYQRIQLNECIKEQCAAYCEKDGKCHKYMNDVEMDAENEKQHGCHFRNRTYRTEKENNTEWKDRMMQTFLGGRR